MSEQPPIEAPQRAERRVASLRGRPHRRRQGQDHRRDGDRDARRGPRRRVAVVQFMKSGRWRSGERIAGERLGIDWSVIGDGFTWDSDDLDRAPNRARGVGARPRRDRGGRARPRRAGRDHLPDELGLDPGGRVRRAAGPRPRTCRVVLTGRDAPAELVALADTVSESANMKHAFDGGVAALEGSTTDGHDAAARRGRERQVAHRRPAGAGVGGRSWCSRRPRRWTRRWPSGSARTAPSGPPHGDGRGAARAGCRHRAARRDAMRDRGLPDAVGLEHARGGRATRTSAGGCGGGGERARPAGRRRSSSPTRSGRHRAARRRSRRRYRDLLGRVNAAFAAEADQALLMVAGTHARADVSQAALDAVIGRIRPADRAAGEAAQEAFDSKTKPRGSLGELERLACRVAAIRRTPSPGRLRAASRRCGRRPRLRAPRGQRLPPGSHRADARQLRRGRRGGERPRPRDGGSARGRGRGRRRATVEHQAVRSLRLGAAGPRTRRRARR